MEHCIISNNLIFWRSSFTSLGTFLKIREDVSTGLHSKQTNTVITI